MESKRSACAQTMTTDFEARTQTSRKIATLISSKDIDVERELHSLKWFDYRFMSPSDATDQFRTEYQRVYRHFYAKNVDTEAAQHKFGLRRIVPAGDQREYTSLWRARQFADTLGIPYSNFLWAAFNRLTQGLSQRIPAPNQMYGKRGPLIAEAVDMDWSEYLDTRLTISSLPHYRTESFQGLAAQLAHRQWVVNEIKRRFGKPRDIGVACFLKRVLPTEIAELEFGLEKVEQARTLVAGETAEAEQAIAMRDLLPSCATLPGAFNAASAECGSCRLNSICSRVSERIGSSLAAEFGSVDPVAARRKKGQAERTRKCRAKKRAAELRSASVS